MMNLREYYDSSFGGIDSNSSRLLCSKSRIIACLRRGASSFTNRSLVLTELDELLETEVSLSGSIATCFLDMKDLLAGESKRA